MNQSYTKSSPVMFLSGVLVGALAGTLAGLWMAPQSGKKTQRMIRQEAARLQHTAEDTLDVIKDSAESVSDDIRKKVRVAH